MCGVDNSQNAPLTTEVSHFLPWKIDTRIGGDAVDNSDDLQLGSVADLTLSCLQFGTQSIEVHAESLQDGCARRWKVQLEGGDRRVRWQVADVSRRPFYGVIGRRCYRPSEKWELGHSRMGRSLTRNDDILRVPYEVSENGVEPVGGIGDENDFVRSCADELGHAMSGRSEVFGKMQFDQSVDISLYGLASSLDSSRNWDRHGTIGT